MLDYVYSKGPDNLVTLPLAPAHASARRGGEVEINASPPRRLVRPPLPRTCAVWQDAGRLEQEAARATCRASELEAEVRRLRADLDSRLRDADAALPGLDAASAWKFHMWPVFKCIYLSLFPARRNPPPLDQQIQRILPLLQPQFNTGPTKFLQVPQLPTLGKNPNDSEFWSQISDFFLGFISKHICFV